MKLKLVKLENRYKQKLFDMLDEWYSAGEKIVPYAIRKTHYHDFEKYCISLKVKDDRPNLVPDSTFFVWTRKEISLSEQSISGII